MRKFCLLWLIAVSLFSCKNDPMDRTVFIPDSEDPELPAYTEWGYNSFGAKYERDYFIATNYTVPSKILHKNSNVEFILSGVTQHNWEEMSMTFIFPFETIAHFTNLIKLNDVNINLADTECTVKLIQDTTETTLSVVNGNLHFKRTQLLRIDDEVDRVILSGVFNVTFLKDDVPASISNGRFDLGITRDLFYKFD